MGIASPAAAAAVLDDDTTLIALAGQACASVVGERDPVQAALDALVEEAQAGAAMPTTAGDEAWLAPSAPADVSRCLTRLAGLPTSGPRLAEDALAAIIAAGKL